MSEIKYTPPASSGGGQNPSANIIPLNNGSANFVDSNLSNIVNTSLYSTNQGNEIGLKLDFASNSYLFGDFTGNNIGSIFLQMSIGELSFTDNYAGVNFFDIINVNSTGNVNLTINADNSIIKTQNLGNDVGLKLDFDTNLYILGDINNGVNNLVFENNRFSSLGDYNGNGNSTTINIDDLQKTIFLYTNSNNTTFLVDGGSDKITFTTGALNFVGTALSDSTIVTPVGRNLIISLNGTQYHIPLYN